MLVYASVSYNAFRKRPSYYRMNNAHLGDPDLQERIYRMWDREIMWHRRINNEPATTLLKGIKQAKCIARTWGKKCIEERKKEEVKLRENLKEAQVSLQSDPQNIACQENIDRAHQVVKEFDHSRA